MERARQDPSLLWQAVKHPLNFNPGIIKGGDWASSVPAWCDVDCRIGILPGWTIADCQAEIVACVEKAARTHPFLADNAPEVVWSGFLSPGYEVTGAQESEAVLAAAYETVFGGPLEDACFTGLTDTRFYGLDYGVPGILLRSQNGKCARLRRAGGTRLAEENHQDASPVHCRLVRRRGAVST